MRGLVLPTLKLDVTSYNLYELKAESSCGVQKAIGLKIIVLEGEAGVF